MAVTLLLFRGINILRNRKGDLSQQTTVNEQEERRRSLSHDLASRRGRGGLSIALNVGDYVVVSNSMPTTPIEAIARPASAFFVNMPPLATSSSGSSFDRKSEAEAEKSGASYGVRRKSSVTFTEEHAPQTTMNVPTLGFIAASPMLSDLEEPKSVVLERAASSSDFA